MKELYFDDDPDGSQIPEWLKSLRLRVHDACTEDEAWSKEEFRRAFGALANGKCSLPSGLAYESLKQAYQTEIGRQRPV